MAILSSFRLDRAGRLVFGSVGALRNTGTAIHKAWARRALSKLYPQLGSAEFEHERYGQIGMTADALPRFHKFGKNAIDFSGYHGRGVSTVAVAANSRISSLAKRPRPNCRCRCR